MKSIQYLGNYVYNLSYMLEPICTWRQRYFVTARKLLEGLYLKSDVTGHIAL